MVYGLRFDDPFRVISERPGPGRPFMLEMPSRLARDDILQRRGRSNDQAFQFPGILQFAVYLC